MRHVLSKTRRDAAIGGDHRERENRKNALQILFGDGVVNRPSTRPSALQFRSQVLGGGSRTSRARRGPLSSSARFLPRQGGIEGAARHHHVLRIAATTIVFDFCRLSRLRCEARCSGAPQPLDQGRTAVSSDHRGKTSPAVSGTRRRVRILVDRERVDASRARASFDERRMVSTLRPQFARPMILCGA